MTAWRVLTWRLLAVVWAIKLFCLSTAGFSGDVSRPFLASLLGLLHISLSAHAFWVLHSILRKVAHLLEYAIFCFLLYRSFGTQWRTAWEPRKACWAMLAAGVYSLTDEFHQSFVRGRGASLVDCGIDIAGATMAMLLVYAAAQVSERRASNRLRPAFGRSWISTLGKEPR